MSKVEGDKAWELAGMRMTTEQVQRMNQLRDASRVRALSSQEEHELWNLSQINKTRTRVIE